MVVKTSELKKAIDKIKPAIKQNDISEFGQYVYITGGHMMSYNGSICVLTKVDLDLNIALPAVEFVQLIDRTSSKEIEFNIDESIDIKGGRVKANFAINDDILNRVKKLNISIPEEFKKLPSDFLSGVKLVRYSVGRDKTQNHLTYLKVKDNILASTDNFRVSQYSMNGEMESMKLPQEILEHLLKYSFDSYAVVGNIVYFKDDETYFMSRLGEVDFVKYEHLFDVEGEKFVFPEKVMDMVSIASITTEGITDIDKVVNIDISNKTIKISSKNEIGSVEVDENIESDINASMVVNSQFMEDILDITKEATISNNLILFKTEKFKQIIALFQK